MAAPPPIETATPGFDESIRLCEQHLALHASSRLLDVPCGAGEALVRLTASKGVTGVGVDLGEVITRAARKATSEISFLQGDGRKLPFPAELFDVVLCIGGPTCISPAIAERRAPSRAELEANLSELVRVLRPGGALVASDKYATTDADPARPTSKGWIELIESAGTHLEHFEDFPVSVWDEYFEPRLERFRYLRDHARSDPQALAVIESDEQGLVSERPEGDRALYGTFIARRPG